MASPNTNFDEITATTLKKRMKKFRDNWSNHNALLMRLRQRGNMILDDGGENLVEELEYQENSTFKYYAGYEVFDVTPSEVFTVAEFDWKQAAVIVSASGLELRKNAGTERTINLLAARIKNAEKTLANNLASGVYADGTGTSGKEVGGLQHLVADTPTSGTVGGIDRSSFSFWRNQTDTNTQTSTNIQSDMNAMWLNLLRGMDKPDLIVADSVQFNFYWESLQTIQRITRVDEGAAGFRSIEYNGPQGNAPVIYDDRAPSKHMYMLNTEYLKLRTHLAANFEVQEQVKSFNQDAIMVPVIWMGNMTCSNASLQGVIIDD